MGFKHQVTTKALSVFFGFLFIAILGGCEKSSPTKSTSKEMSSVVYESVTNGPGTCSRGDFMNSNNSKVEYACGCPNLTGAGWVSVGEGCYHRDAVQVDPSCKKGSFTNPNGHTVDFICHCNPVNPQGWVSVGGSCFHRLADAASAPAPNPIPAPTVPPVSPSPEIPATGVFSHGSFNLIRDTLLSLNDWKKFHWRAGLEGVTSAYANPVMITSGCTPGNLSCALTGFPKAWGRSLTAGKGFILQVLIPPGADGVWITPDMPNTFARGRYGWVNAEPASYEAGLKCALDNPEALEVCAEHLADRYYQSSETKGYLDYFSGAQFIVNVKAATNKAHYKNIVVFVTSEVPLILMDLSVSVNIKDKAKFDTWKRECADQNQVCLGREF